MFHAANATVRNPTISFVGPTAGCIGCRSTVFWKQHPKDYVRPPPEMLKLEDAGGRLRRPKVVAYAAWEVTSTSTADLPRDSCELLNEDVVAFFNQQTTCVTRYLSTEIMGRMRPPVVAPPSRTPHPTSRREITEADGHAARSRMILLSDLS